MADIPAPPSAVQPYTPEPPYAAEVDTAQFDLNDELQRQYGPLKTVRTYSAPADTRLETIAGHYASRLSGWTRTSPPMFKVRHAQASVWTAHGEALAVALTDAPPPGAPDAHKVLLVAEYGRR